MAKRVTRLLWTGTSSVVNATCGDIHTQKIIEELTKKGAFVLHMSGDELDCFTDFFNKTKCPPDMLLCVLDSILHQDQRCEKEGRQTLNFHSLSLL